MFKRLLALAAVVGLLGSTGCIANHRYGCDNPNLVPVGSPEHLVYGAHGAPDQIIEIGNAVGPQIHHWTKYLVVYRIGEGHMLLGNIMQSDKFANLCYLIDNKKVAGCGYADEGEGQTILMSLADAPHPKARVGYGGDFGYAGSYGQEGRTGGAITGQSLRDFYPAPPSLQK
ncbi:MAG TPA: hypothetical protein VFF73_38405 [Planctomycetota bacterium]|jgi:hypothetical protein|nr:hypothetical protein [Planctomycetota bacterium]